MIDGYWYVNKWLSDDSTSVLEYYELIRITANKSFVSIRIWIPIDIHVSIHVSIHISIRIEIWTGWQPGQT